MILAAPGRHLRRKHPLCRLEIDEGIGIEMRGDDVRPLIEDEVQRLIAFHIKDGNRAAPGPRIDVPAYPARFVPCDPRPEGLPRGRKLGGPVRAAASRQ